MRLACMLCLCVLVVISIDLPPTARRGLIASAVHLVEGVH